MFDWLGTFVEKQFDVFTVFLEKIDGGRVSYKEREKHLAMEKKRFDQMLSEIVSIDARRKAGTLSRWREEPIFPDESFRARPISKGEGDAEAGLFIDAMRFVWRRFIWHKKDESSYNLLKLKDRIWQIDEELRDLSENIGMWAKWKQHVKQMIAQSADPSGKIYPNLTQKNDDPPKY